MDIYGYLWVSMDIYGYLWISMDIYGMHGYLWISMDIHGYPWISMDIYGYLWISMDIYGYLWISINIYENIYGYLWISMDIHGYLLISMDIYGYLWIFMDIYGYLWISRLLYVIVHLQTGGRKKRFLLMTSLSQVLNRIHNEFKTALFMVKPMSKPQFHGDLLRFNGCFGMKLSIAKRLGILVFLLGRLSVVPAIRLPRDR